MKAMTMYHPNGKGTGSAMKLELRPAHGETDGSVLVTLAPQEEARELPNHDGYATNFNWDKAISAKFDMIDLTQMLMVLRGAQESIADGKGLFHRTASANIVIKFEHRIEPVPGYVLDISEKPLNGEIRRSFFYLRPVEAYALCSIIEQALLLIAFGVPAEA